MKIKLYTSIGHFIEELEIDAPYSPEVIFWDSRAFKLKQQNIFYQVSYFTVPQEEPPSDSTTLLPPQSMKTYLDTKQLATLVMDKRGNRGYVKFLRKWVSVYRLSEINEEHEIAFFFRQFECPQCGGMGAYENDTTWLDGRCEWEECDECDGEGILFLRDCRPCKNCGEKIYFENQEGKWKPFNAETDEFHKCQFKDVAP